LRLHTPLPSAPLLCPTRLWALAVPALLEVPALLAMPAPLLSALLHHAQRLVLARLLLRLPLRLAGRAPLPCPTRRGLLAVPAPLPVALLHHAQRLVLAHQVLAHAQLLASPACIRCYRPPAL